MKTNEDLFKGYDSHEGMGAAFYAVITISLLVVVSFGAIIYAIV